MEDLECLAGSSPYAATSREQTKLRRFSCAASSSLKKFSYLNHLVVEPFTDMPIGTIVRRCEHVQSYQALTAGF